MTAQPVASSLPLDPAPNPPPAAETGRGNHFLAVLGGKSATTGAPTAAVPSNVQASTVPVTRVPAARKPTDTSNQTKSGTSDGATSSSNGNDSTSTVIALPVPLLAQLQQPPAPVVSSATGASAPIATAPAAPQTATGLSPLAIAAASITSAPSLSSTNAVGTTSLPPASLAPPFAAPAITGTSSAPVAQSGVAATSAPSPSPAAGANPSGSASAALPGATVITNQPSGNTPTLASTINARLANGAAVLVSQPRVALASLTPASDKPAAKVATSDGGLPTNARQLAAIDGGHDAPEPPAASTGHSDQALGTGKENAAIPASLLEAHETTTHEPALPPVNDNPTADATSAPASPPVVPVNAPPSQSEPLATLSVVPHAVAEQVAINVHQAVKSGVDHIQIQLQPADLGAIDVKLNVNHDGRVTVVVSADRSDTLNLLQQDAGGLTQALRDAGLQTDNSSLSFNLRGGFQFQQQQSTGGGATSRDAAYSSDPDEVIVPATPSVRRHAGSLDIHV